MKRLAIAIAKALLFVNAVIFGVYLVLVGIKWDAEATIFITLCLIFLVATVVAYAEGES